ncbi:GntR family transcriptional regulator [Nostoc sp. NIES-2111]
MAEGAAARNSGLAFAIEELGISISRETLGDSVYAALCESLVKGRLKPNDRLRIRDLATALGTSVTPIRDAILKLVQDRALVLRSARDIRVPLLSPEDYLEIREIRLNLEGMAAFRAAERGSAVHAARLDEILHENEAAFARGDVAAATELNQVFHFELADIAGMPILRDILGRLWLRMGPVLADLHASCGPELVASHHAVVQAVRRRDGAAAADAIRADILSPGRQILERLEELARSSGAPGPEPAAD